MKAVTKNFNRTISKVTSKHSVTKEPTRLELEVKRLNMMGIEILSPQPR